MQFESEPAGAEARTSLGESCRTPCSLAVTSSEFTVSFTLQGYQPQTIPVRVVAPTDGSSTGSDGEAAAPRLVPNPVFVELQPAGRPLAPARPKPAARPKPRPKPAPAAPTAMAPPPPAPEAAPASPWPPPPSR